MDQNIAKNIWQSLVLAVLAEKSIENASVRLSFCRTGENTVYSLILNIAETVGSHTSHNDEWVEISQKNILQSLI